eukprot:1161060-Pelagomonas_calceolata.AAC.16
MHAPFPKGKPAHLARLQPRQNGKLEWMAHLGASSSLPHTGQQQLLRLRHARRWSHLPLLQDAKSNEQKVAMVAWNACALKHYPFTIPICNIGNKHKEAYSQDAYLGSGANCAEVMRAYTPVLLAEGPA